MDDIQHLTENLVNAGKAVGAEVTSFWFAIQLALILLAVVVSATLGALFRRRVDVNSIAKGWPIWPQRILHQLAENFGTIIFLLLMASIRATMVAATLPSRSYLIAVAAKLATAWIVIALTAGLIQNRFVYRVIATWAWILAALSILGILEPVRALLDSVSINLGGIRLSPLLVLKVSILSLITLWVAMNTSDFLDTRVRRIADLTPSLQVLVGKVIRILLIALAVMVVMSAVGIDISALAVFSGAVGVGVGFGLQKIVSNIVSGMILLADKSIKPGDVISVGDSFGWVITMGARYTSVNTRDGREVLIPNEDLVTQRVTNWSYSANDIRLDVNFCVDMGADPHQVQQLALDTVKKVPRVLLNPPPACHFMGFSNKQLDFSLRFWINDPIEGSTNLKSAALLALWDSLKGAGIDLPSPTQDMRLRGPVQVAPNDFSEK